MSNESFSYARCGHTARDINARFLKGGNILNLRLSLAFIFY